MAIELDCGYHVFATAFGHVAIAWRGEAIVSLRLPAEDPDDAERSIQRHVPNAMRATPPDRVVSTAAAIKRYFAGEPADFTDVVLDVGKPGVFTARVYAHVRALRRSETTTYGAVAHALEGGREGARAVGRAMATNPVPLLIPCHRVLAIGGALGGFSAPGGTGTKARMLALEGTTAAAQQTFAF